MVMRGGTVAAQAGAWAAVYDEDGAHVVAGRGPARPGTEYPWPRHTGPARVARGGSPGKRRRRHHGGMPMSVLPRGIARRAFGPMPFARQVQTHTLSNAADAFFAVS